MRNIGRMTLLTVLFVAVTFTGTAWAGWWDGVGDAETIKLKDVIENPRKWKDKEIVFDCYFHEVSEFYNPYYTRFLPDLYVNFSVWPEGAHLWDKEVYSHSFHFLFLEKDHKRFGDLVGMKKFAHLRVRGYVQNTFKNVPWIEVRAVKVLEDSITRDSLREIILGDRAADREQWAVALEHYDRAAASPLPKAVQAGLEKKRGQAYEGQGRFEAAMSAYELARQLDQSDEEANDLLAAMAKRLGRPAPTRDLQGTEPKDEGDRLVEARPVDEGRYPPEPMAMPAPVNGAEGEAAAVDEPENSPATTPVEMDEPIAPPRPEQPAQTKPVEAEAPAEAAPAPQIEEPGNPPAPIRTKKTPKKRMSGPV